MPLPVGPASYIGSLLRKIQEQRAVAPHATKAETDVASPMREAVQTPLDSPLKAESPGSSRTIGIRPESAPEIQEGTDGARVVTPGRSMIGAIGGVPGGLVVGPQQRLAQTLSMTATPSASTNATPSATQSPVPAAPATPSAQVVAPAVRSLAQPIGMTPEQVADLENQQRSFDAEMNRIRSMQPMTLEQFNSPAEATKRIKERIANITQTNKNNNQQSLGQVLGTSSQAPKKTSAVSQAYNTVKSLASKLISLFR